MKTQVQIPHITWAGMVATCTYSTWKVKRGSLGQVLGKIGEFWAQ